MSTPQKITCPLLILLTSTFFKQVLRTVESSTLVLPYTNPMYDPPELELLYPVPMDHTDFPSVHNGSKVQIRAATKGGVNVRSGQVTDFLKGGRKFYDLYFDLKNGLFDLHSTGKVRVGNSERRAE
jgi:hypothetical protein